MQNIDKLIKTCTWSVLPYLSAHILTLGGASQILSLKKTTAATVVGTTNQMNKVFGDEIIKYNL